MQSLSFSSTTFRPTKCPDDDLHAKDAFSEGKTGVLASRPKNSRRVDFFPLTWYAIAI
jgi:hypothetical protein